AQKWCVRVVPEGPGKIRAHRFDRALSRQEPLSDRPPKDLKIFPIDEMRIRPQAGSQIMEIARPVGPGFRQLLDRCGTNLEREAPPEPLLQDRIDLIPLR